MGWIEHWSAIDYQYAENYITVFKSFTLGSNSSINLIKLFFFYLSVLIAHKDK